MSKPITARQSRHIDKQASEVLGLPSIVLMENAASNAAKVIGDFVSQKQLGKAGGGGIGRCAVTVGIICGGGNNGGDGYGIARHLRNKNYKVTVYNTKHIDNLTGDAAINAHVCNKMGIKIVTLEDQRAIDQAGKQWQEMDILVDCLLGVGFHGKLRQPARAVIE